QVDLARLAGAHRPDRAVESGQVRRVVRLDEIVAEIDVAFGQRDPADSYRRRVRLRSGLGWPALGKRAFAHRRAIVGAGGDVAAARIRGRGTRGRPRGTLPGRARVRPGFALENVLQV